MLKLVICGMALDRSMRSIHDKNGWMKVERTCIARACVDEYLGSEIPEYETLGLDPARVYKLLRDPVELERAAPSFDSVPILLEHVPVHAYTPQNDLIVGTTGSGTEFSDGRLWTSLNIWDDRGVYAIDTGIKEELSPGYFYKADMTPGIFDGLQYDGVMRSIDANHVALVRLGRQGPTVVVADEKPEGPVVKKTRLLVSGALVAYAKPKMAVDAKLDIAALTVGLTRANFAARRDHIISEVVKIAKDAKSEELGKILDDCAAEDEDDEDDSGDGAMDENESPPLEAGKKPAMDRAPAIALDQAAVTRMIAQAQQEGRRLALALDAVRPFVGDLKIDDHATAPSVYKLALDSKGIKTQGIHPDAYRPMFESLVANAPVAPVSETALAFDAAIGDDKIKAVLGFDLPPIVRI